MYILRWLGLYAGLLVLLYAAWIYRNKEYKYLKLVILYICTGYYALYLLQGLIFEFILGMGKWDSQSILVAGNAYAVFGCLIAIPISLEYYNQNKNKKFIVLFTILLTTVAFYFESRVLLFILLAFGVASLFVIHWKKSLIYLMIVVVTLCGWLGWVTICRTTGFGSLDLSYVSGYTDLIRDYTTSFKNIGKVEPLDILRDTDRIAHNLAPIDAVKDKPFGYGTYQSHYVLRSYLEKYGETQTSTLVYTTGFASYLTDYGWVGFGLLTINFLLTGLIILLKRNKYWLFYGMVICGALLWLFISNITDNMLWWLLITPQGLIWRLNN